MGVSGAMLAEALTGAGLGVVMLDRRGPILGSTMATTALVQFEIDQPLTRLKRKIGTAKAERAWRRSRLAMVNLAGRVEELGIRCDAVAKPSLYLAGDMLDGAALRSEAEARRLVGIHSAVLPAAEIAERFGIAARAALLSHGNLALDPRKLTAGLLDLAAARGARLYAPTEAVAFEEDGGRVHVATSDGPTASARFLVLATGYELLDGVPTAGHSVLSTYALATGRQPRLDGRRLPLVWEASDPYLYFRGTADGRLICGGEDETFADEERRDALLGRKIAAISRKLARRLPAADTAPDYAWAGSFGASDTGLPSIGRLPRRRRSFAVMGYGGNGITYSQIASELVLAAIQGGDDIDADLYRLPCISDSCISIHVFVTGPLHP